MLKLLKSQVRPNFSSKRSTPIYFQRKYLFLFIFLMNSIRKSDEKEKLVYFSIIDNYMKNVNYEEILTTDPKVFKIFIENIEKLMTIYMKNIDFPDSSTKFQEFMKHGFIFKCSGSLQLKCSKLSLMKNKDANFLQKFLKYYMITGYIQKKL